MRFGDVMTRSVVTIRADASVREATRLLIKHRRGSLGARPTEIGHKIESRKSGSKKRRGRRLAHWMNTGRIKGLRAVP